MPTADEFLDQFDPKGTGASAAPSGASPPNVDDFLSQWEPPGGQSAPASAPAVAPAQGQILGPTRYLAGAGSAALKGLGLALGLPGDLESLGVRYLANPLTRAFGGQPEDPNNTLLPTSERVLEPLRAAGLVDNPALAPGAGPYPRLERYGSAAITGATAALPFALASGASLPGKALQLASGAGSFDAATAAHDLLPQIPWAPAVAALGTGLVGAGLGSALETGMTNRAAQQAYSSAQQASQAAESALQQARNDLAIQRLRRPDDLAAVRAKSQAVLDAQVQAAQAARQTAEAQITPVMEATAAKLGQSRTLEDAGAKAQGIARDWLTGGMQTKLSALWDPVNDMAKGIPVQRSFFSDALRDLTSRAGSNQSLVDAISPTLGKRLVSKFFGDEEGAVPGVADSPQTWEEAQRLRTALGDAMTNPKVINDLPQGALKRLYAAQTADMQSAIGRLPPDGLTGQRPLDLFQQANNESSRLYNLAERSVGKIVAGPRANSADPLPGDAAARLLSGGRNGGQELSDLRAEMPELVDELGAAALRKPGAWDKLSPEARMALVPDAQARSAIDAVVNNRNFVAGAGATQVMNAKAAHQANVAQAQAAQRAAELAARQNIGQLQQTATAARNAENAAKAALPASRPGAPLDIHLLSHMMRHPLGGLSGGALGLLGNDMLGVGEGRAAAMGALIGTVAPYMAKGAWGLARDPGLWPYPLVAGQAPQGIPTMTIQVGASRPNALLPTAGQ